MASKTLIVLRHAKSSWNTPETDIRRPLSSRGRADAVAAGEILAGYTLDVVLASSATRVQETWERAQLGGAACADVRTSEAIYHAWAGELLGELHDLDESVHIALLIGHQPTLGDLIATLAKPSALTDRVSAKFPTAGLAVLTYRGAWKTLGAGKASLKRFEIPRG
ncbi:MAG TPA: histidine phosphatase family protein [Propionicimonas sp.]|mgnify:CR=1 FL=1|nr:histidine phosphatase family protein [Propionicimonas sp.]HRA05273.1 histidine phosphatase family protein [Propionicimonas sp.]